MKRIKGESPTAMDERSSSMSKLLNSIPATEGVRKVGRGEGEKLDVAGAHLI
jgi:hypothetical protein